MLSDDSVRKIFKKIEQEQAAALGFLSSQSKKPSSLPRPIFFISGVTDEVCSAWEEPCKSKSIPAIEWLKRIYIESGTTKIYPIHFSKKDSEDSHTFVDFSRILKERIWRLIGTSKKFDIAGYSMGGLVVRAAMIDSKEPLLNVKNCITFATPHEGTLLGAFNKAFLQGVKGATESQALQIQSMAPTHFCMQMLNDLTMKQLFLKRTERLFSACAGSDAAIARSSVFSYKNMEKEFPDKVINKPYSGAAHNGPAVITQDTRAILDLVNLLRI